MPRPKKYDYGYLTGPVMYPFTDKERALRNYEAYTLDKTLRLFKWENLPETIPQRELELIIQLHGFAAFAEVDGKLYAFRSGLGGLPNEYYFPTEATICNPYLRYETVAKIGTDCALVFNDTCLNGVMPLIDRYASQLVENDITQHLANINMRLSYVIKCSDDSDKAAAEKFLKDIIEGKLGSLQADEFFGSIDVQPLSSSGQGNQVTQLIEYAQFLRTQLLREFGIETENGNIKREYVNQAEIDQYNGSDGLLVDDMLKCRQEGAERVNELFGTDIKVTLAKSYTEQREPEPELDETIELDEAAIPDSEPEAETAAETEPKTEPEAEPETEEPAAEPDTVEEAVEDIVEAIEDIAETVEEAVEEAAEVDIDNEN